MACEPDTNVLKLTAKIVSAHIGRNQVSADVLPELIQSVHRSLAAARMAGADESAREAASLASAVPIRRSVFPDYLVCLEAGNELDFGHFRSCVDPEMRLGGDVFEGFVKRHGRDAERP